MKNKMSVKLSDENINFLNKISINCIKSDTETKILTPSQALDRLERYNKSDNDSYIDMIRMENEK